MKLRAALLAAGSLATPALAALPEMDTAYYGRVLHPGGGEEHQITSGELRWLVEPPSPESGTATASGSTNTSAAPDPVEIKITLSSMKGGQSSSAPPPRRKARKIFP